MEEAWIFGDRLEHVHYIVRRGAYAVIINDGMIAVVKTPTGYFLPGGGVEGTETFENRLKREVLEETGYTSVFSNLSDVRKSISTQRLFMTIWLAMGFST
jgi:8-oxo-dGTP pyrophosphatase MutT (NUDIX family)